MERIKLGLACKGVRLSTSPSDCSRRAVLLKAVPVNSAMGVHLVLHRLVVLWATPWSLLLPTVVVVAIGPLV